MSLYGISDTTPCANCGDEFANHDYVPESIDQYRCPHPHVEHTYGYFHGGDPRDFHPDYECCSPEEIERWQLACDEAEKLAHHRELPCPSGWERTPYGDVHVLRAPFGIGSYTWKMETFFEAREADAADDEDEDGDSFRRC